MPQPYPGRDPASVAQRAQIIGKVEYREGDGASITIRPGPCEVVVTALDATISWSDGDWRGSAAIPLSDLRRFVARKALRMLDTPVAGAAAASTSNLTKDSS